MENYKLEGEFFMLSFKRLAILVLMAVLSVSAFAQSNSSEERSVEESYLQEAIEMMIIKEMSRGDSLDQKYVALEYIGDAIDRGNTGTEVRQALEFLSTEGTRTVAREGGRVVNNFPHVRRQAARYLGQINNEEAKDALIQILQSGEKETMVLMEAVKSLGEIGINKNGETVEQIAWIVSRVDNTNPDNLLALATVEAFEKIHKANGSISPNAIQLLMRISQGQYIKPVQERAKQAIANIRAGN